MSSPLRCVLAEDEVESRTNVVGFLSSVPGLELVGVAASGPEAVALVEEKRPDLLLLDIRLPEMDGVEVLRRLKHRPEVVFTTAHESYAVAAFELGALDYLVKPFGRDRLVAAIERVRARGTPGRAETTAVDRALAASHRPLRRLFARRGDRIIPVSVDDIVRVGVSGEYSEIHAGRETYLVQIPLKELLACLDPATFEQVHRSHIVNLNAVTHFRAADDRRLLVTLKDGSTVLASRAASERIRQRIR
ncbi:MAG: LytR/AlgR family response regulator transcription factor [Thermoanaerobaculia bacterium]